MGGSAETRQPKETPSPQRLTYDDFLNELMRIAEDAAECTVPLGPRRKRRIEIVERLLILLDVGKPKVFPVLRDVQRQIER